MIAHPTDLLLPPPKRSRQAEGRLPLSERWCLRAPAPMLHRLSEAIEPLREALAPSGVRLERNGGLEGPALPVVLQEQSTIAAQAYTLTIEPGEGIRLEACGAPGFFYGLQTLRQLVGVEGPRLSACVIEDAPDFPVRGVYHDVCRGKVPTRHTLFALVRKLATFKVNQLQLYMEHTFTFAGHPDIWQGTDALSAEDVAALDAYCRAHFIELVPSLSCFGHFCTPLRSPRLEHLNELELAGSQRPFSWWDRMQHFTLDCANPEALELVGGMIAELRPAFASDLFNICCDETFDLGKGRNREAAGREGLGQLYLRFVNGLCAKVHENHATPMLWADIVAKHPEIAAELDPRAILLEWGYSPEIKQERIDLMRESGRTFYVCPGCQGWNSFVANWHNAWLNITRMARAGHAAGAVGLLNTDWGDKGHVNCLGHSFYGYLAGAWAGWNVQAADPDDSDAFDRAFAFWELGGHEDLIEPIREVGRHAHPNWGGLAFWTDPTPDFPEDWFSTEYRLPNTLVEQDPEKVRENLHSTVALQDELSRRPAPALADPLLWPEILAGTEGSRLCLATAALMQVIAGKCDDDAGIEPAALADAWRRFEVRLGELWHARNRPSEFFRLRMAFMEIANRIDRFGSSG